MGEHGFRFIVLLLCVCVLFGGGGGFAFRMKCSGKKANGYSELSNNRTGPIINFRQIGPAVLPY